MTSIFLIQLSIKGSSQGYPSFPSKTDQSIRSSSHNLIESAFSNKRIPIDEKILYHVYAMFDKAKLPVEFHSTEPEYCGTWVMDEILRNWNTLAPLTRDILMKRYKFTENGTRSRPTGLNSTRSTDHFIIHFSVVSGDTNAVDWHDNNGNETPDYVDSVMLYAEQSWNHEINLLLYYPPPPDLGMGGDDKIDIYLLKISAYGLCYGENLVWNNPNSPFNEVHAATSYITIRNQLKGQSYSEFSILRTTVCHEFFHSIQSGYDLYEAIWLKEAMAAWMEDEVYDNDEVNLRWLPSWFGQPWIPLDATNEESSNHWYGSWIFFRFLSELYGSPAINRIIWEKAINYVDTTGTDHSFSAIEDALAVAGWSIKGAFHLFALANFFPSYKYDEGEKYPSVNSSGFALNNYSIVTNANKRTSEYYVVSPNILPKGNDVIEIEFMQYDWETKFDVQVITRKNSGIYSYPMEIDLYSAKYILTPTKDLNEIAVVVTNYDTSGNTNRYELKIKANSLIHRITTSNASWGVFPTLATSMGTVSWEDLGDLYGRFYDGKIIRKVGTSDFIGQRPALHNGKAAWVDRWNFANNPFYYYWLSYFNGTSIQYIKSNQWDVSLPSSSVHPTVLLNDSAIVFGIRDIEYSDKMYHLVMSDNAGPVRMISDSLHKPPIPCFLSNGQVIWVKDTYYDPLWKKNEAYWYNGIQNQYPPTKHRTTVPVLHDSKMAWIESYEDVLPAPDSTYELYYFDGTTTTRITNDHVADNIGLPLIGFDFKNGKIAWSRNLPSNWWNTDDRLFVHLYENGEIRILRDSITQKPAMTYNSPIRIDEKKGYVVWKGCGISDIGIENIYLYNGKSIIPVLPESMAVKMGDLTALDIDDGKIAFTAYCGIENDPLTGIHVYLYEYDSTYVSIEEKDKRTSLDKQLLYCYPNPFGSAINIQYAVPCRSFVSLKIYNALGEEIRTLMSEDIDAGSYTRTWHAATLPNGIYIVQFIAGNSRKTQKIVLLR